MSSLKIVKADEETISVLEKCKIEDKIIFLPNIQLERELYEKVNKCLNALGAKWNKKLNGHVFDYDISNGLKKLIETGEVVNWKKSTDFFHTPKEVVENMMGFLMHSHSEKFTILEPSAGQGHILDVLKEEYPNIEIFCVEQNPLHCDRLRKKGYRPINDDFSNVKPFEVDVVIMNPPFTYEKEHIKHAYNFLNETGTLISVTSASILSKNDKKTKEFKNWFNSVNGEIFPLPKEIFRESGTDVSTNILVIDRFEE